MGKIPTEILQQCGRSSSHGPRDHVSTTLNTLDRLLDPRIGISFGYVRKTRKEEQRGTAGAAYLSTQDPRDDSSLSPFMALLIFLMIMPDYKHG